MYDVRHTECLHRRPVWKPLRPQPQNAWVPLRSQHYSSLFYANHFLGWHCGSSIHDYVSVKPSLALPTFHAFHDVWLLLH